MTLDTLAADAQTAAEDGKQRSLLRRLVRNPLGVTAIVLLAVIILISFLSPWLSPYDPNVSDLSDTFAPPSPEHLLGTDSAGRDVLSRLISGGRLTLLGAAVGLVVAVTLGLLTGLIAGYYGGLFDTTSDLTVSLIMALPNIMVLLALRAVVGPSLWITMTVFGILVSPAIYRLVRSGVRQVRNELFVDAARVSGLSDVRIIGRHILFVVRAPIIIQGSLLAGIAIAVQSGLEFLGLGDSSVPTWGVMLSEAFRNIYIAPDLIIWPGVAIALTIGSLVLLGNALRDALEDRAATPKLRKQPRAKRGGHALPVEPATAPSTDVLLSVQGLTVGYPAARDDINEVIHEIGFDLQKGEVLGLVGESGSGKTQTAWSILGLLPQGGIVTGGRIIFDGKELTSMPTRERRRLLGRRIAYVPQEPMSNLDPFYTIGNQLIRPMTTLLGVSRKEARRSALRLLERVGIADPARTMASYPHEISGGMAQRVLIAGAVSCDAEIIIADEPTTALDVTVQAEILDLLRELQRERNMSMILVTHSFGVVADLCDRVVVMRSGRVVEDGDVESVFYQPQHAYTRSLLSATLDGAAARAERDDQKGTFDV